MWYNDWDHLKKVGRENCSINIVFGWEIFFKFSDCMTRIKKICIKWDTISKISGEKSSKVQSQNAHLIHGAVHLCYPEGGSTTLNSAHIEKLTFFVDVHISVINNLLGLF